MPFVARGDVTVATTTIQAPAGSVPPGSTVSVICRAEGNTVSGMGLGSTTTTINRIDVSVDGGTLAATQITGAVSRPCSSNATATCSWLEGSVAWTTPSTAGTYNASCTITYTNTPQIGPPQTLTYPPTSASITTVAVSFLPPVVEQVTGPSELPIGGTGTFEVTATDPNGWPLSYTWTATAGSIVRDSANPARATWTAPAATGAQTITVSVTNGPFTVPAQKPVNVVLAAYQAGLPLPLLSPRRLASNGTAGVFVVDAQQSSPGQLLLATAKGETRGFAQVPEPALAVTNGAGVLWVTTTTGNLYRLDPLTGRNLGKVPLSDGALAFPLGIAFDAANMHLWIAEKNGDCVRVVTLDGATVTYVSSANGASLVAPVDVAIDASAGKAWVLVQEAKSGPATGEPIEVARFLHSFDLAGQHVGSFVAKGTGPGQLTRAGGMTLGPAGIYLSDSYISTVQVVSPAGAALGSIGAWGQTTGQLTTPMGLALMANGDLAVANYGLGKVDRFGSGAALPVCSGDSDCDGLSDAWELANGLNPNWAGDSLLDLDGDGLNNAAELVAGTNPAKRDTDGDGYSDADELASGYDPLNPDDHKALVAVSAPAETPPGLVKLRATATGPGACTVAWTQRAGPNVALAGADSDAPTFIARAAGSYGFDAVATCGTSQSIPARATVVVKDVAPIAAAGGVIVALPSTPVRLDALASSDANGDTLAFTWDQTLGAPVMGSKTDGAVVARPRATGLYAFQVTVADGGGNASTAEVPVLIADGQAPTAIAAAFPADAQAGATVTLDASTSIVYEGSTFSWRQLSGPTVTLAGANLPAASFVAATAGRYVFDVVAGSGPMRTPPAKVEVFVAEAGGSLPTVTAAGVPPIVAVGQPVSLEATPAPATATVTWRQVSGPAAGLTEADTALATVVPFSPGFHVFEASAQDGAAQGHPIRVAFEARAGGTAIPQARVTTAPGDAWVGQLVFLDGRASSGAARFHWAQAAGPWVVVGMQGPVATFRPLAAGLYVFELVVDDGVTRSAPARIEVNVVPPGVQ